MSSMEGGSKVDLWAEIVAEEGNSQQPIIQQPVYQRRRRTQPQITPKDVALAKVDLGYKENRVRFPAAATNRISWNRSLSTRGRVSIAVAACVEKQPQQKHAKKKGRKPPIPKGKTEQQPNFEKEKQYFEEVDAFELLEESPSPTKFSTWAAGNQLDSTAIPHLSTRLEKWLISRKLQYNCEPSSTLSKILETPAMPPLNSICAKEFDTVTMKTPEKSSLGINSSLHSVHNRINAYLLEKDAFERGSCAKNTSSMIEKLHGEGFENIESAVRKLSLASSTSSLDHDHLSPFYALLAVCEQSAPSTLLDVFSKYCDPKDIIKVGEGAYGEAFKAGATVCKVVPFDGELRVNGEVQKKSEELLEEVILSKELNHLRRHDGDAYNACTTFIETLDLRVCQGPYDQSLIRAWEDWDDKHGSENDHPKDFPANQRYVVFVLQHGGKDLESFVLLNFEEARSLLVQVTAALAVAEAAYEFEHRDLHWGNILLSRNDTAPTSHFILEGKNMLVKTSGLLVSIIDFTLSRINTGKDVLFLDLSSDPDIFTGPKGDKQSETYRKMKEVTEDFWQESFPRTNVLWLLYLVDILLLKKSFERSSKNERDMRSLKKRLDKYNSAKEAIFDPFFSDLFA